MKMLMISVAKKPRPSYRAKISVNTPGINRHFEKTRRLAQKDKIPKWKIANRRVFSKYYSIFLVL